MVEVFSPWGGGVIEQECRSCFDKSQWQQSLFNSYTPFFFFATSKSYAPNVSPIAPSCFHWLAQFDTAVVRWNLVGLCFCWSAQKFASPRFPQHAANRSFQLFLDRNTNTDQLQTKVYVRALFKNHETNFPMRRLLWWRSNTVNYKFNIMLT